MPFASGVPDAAVMTDSMLLTPPIVVPSGMYVLAGTRVSTDVGVEAAPSASGRRASAASGACPSMVRWK